MKKILIGLIILLLSSNFSIGQKGKSNLDLNLDIGYAWLFSDFVGGPLLGITLTNEKYDCGLSIRNDFLIKLGRNSYVDTTGTRYYLKSMAIVEYNTLTYFEGHLGLKRFINVPLSFGLGYGWINTNENDNVKLNPEYGYSVLTIKANYLVSWVMFEIRGNIILQKDYYNRHYPGDRLFPVEIAAFYRFKPKKAN